MDLVTEISIDVCETPLAISNFPKPKVRPQWLLNQVRKCLQIFFKRRCVSASNFGLLFSHWSKAIRNMWFLL